MTPRIDPLAPPYDREVGERLRKMMGGVDAEPLALFRIFARNMPMTRAMGPWGGYELGPKSSIDRSTRELIIDRVCVRCRCEYEWGVHVAVFGEPPIDDLVSRLVDELHDHADVPEDLWDALSERFSDEQILDMLMLAGWYHAICYVANAARLPLEQWAARFPMQGDTLALGA